MQIPLERVALILWLAQIGCGITGMILGVLALKRSYRSERYEREMEQGELYRRECLEQERAELLAENAREDVRE
jgi:hypothetical protein